jgi:hypothetical protein
MPRLPNFDGLAITFVFQTRKRTAIHLPHCKVIPQDANRPLPADDRFPKNRKLAHRRWVGRRPRH